MRKIVTALIAAACIAGTAMASSNTAQARWGGGGGWHGGPGFGGWRGGPGFGGGWHGGGGWYPGLGIAAGVAAGAILGGVLASPYGYGGYYPYGYGVTPGYGYGGAAFYGYGGGDCYPAQVWGPYGPHLVQICQ